MIVDNESIWAMVGTVIGFAMGFYVGYIWRKKKYVKPKQNEGGEK